MKFHESDTEAARQLVIICESLYTINCESGHSKRHKIAIAFYIYALKQTIKYIDSAFREQAIPKFWVLLCQMAC